ncbi:MAG: radical SAM-associated putative lipoprotein [Bacteroidales bacterium]|nr:radical SAM-associated putative lipoprotein [Bacteroidales bacterium]
MSDRIIKPRRRLGFFALLLSALGLAGCDTTQELKDDTEKEMLLMYGSPTVHYSVKGKVTDQSGKPIEGISVRVSKRSRTAENVSFYYPIEADVTTDSGGNWMRGSAHGPTDTLRITFTDIDGDAGGGQFAPDSVFVPVKIVKDENNKSPWYIGDAKVSVPTVKLKKQ